MPALRFLALIVFLISGATARADGIAWQPWSEQGVRAGPARGQAGAVDMEAVWCHWCHVMDATTYQDPAVIRLIAAHFIAVKVDQDGNPALSQRYEDWGWPATVMFDGQGRALNKERGYVEPAAMVQLLQALVDKPECPWRRRRSRQRPHC